MSVTKSKDGTYWQVRVFPHGKSGKEIKRRTRTRAEGINLEKEILAKYQDPDYNDLSRDTRTLADLIEAEHQIHGKTLSDGEKRKRKLLALAERIGNPRANRFNAASFAVDREERLNKGIKENTVNREHSYLRSVFSRLIKAGMWKGDNPLKSIEQIKVQESTLAWLDKRQRKALLTQCADSKSKDLLPVVLICLSTGARWMEAVTITKDMVKDGMIQFSKTKGKKVRFVGITPELEAMILQHSPYSRSQLFRDPVRAFRTAIENANITLPEGQNTHVLRRTFAVNFMQQNGNIRELQMLMGHSTLAMTEKYLRFAPIRPDSAQKLNPVITDKIDIFRLQSFSEGGTKVEL